MIGFGELGSLLNVKTTFRLVRKAAGHTRHKNRTVFLLLHIHWRAFHNTKCFLFLFFERFSKQMNFDSTLASEEFFFVNSLIVFGKLASNLSPIVQF